MPASKSSSHPQERRAALAALAEIVAPLRTDVLIAALPLLSELTLWGRMPTTAAMGRRFTSRLWCVRRWAALRASPANATVPDRKLYERVVAEAKARHPDSRVSARAVRRWRELYNKGPGGLAAGPAALLDLYKTSSRNV